jgi:pimeloyl-ACP methyl ester carboxylesterase
MEPSPPTFAPDQTFEPEGFVVITGSGVRIHFLDWDGSDLADGPRTADGPGSPGVLTIHGLSQTGWIWAPVARRLGGPAGSRRFVSMDLRGHGLSDAPTDDGAYDLDVLASDVEAVAEGSGLLGADREAPPAVVLAGHGFGAIVAATAALELGARCAGLVLVDGGWESLEASTGLDVDEFLRGLDEPPEVMRSLAAFLADRSRFDPGSWDADQDRAARATVVETHAGRVVPATRPHALEACVRAMFTYDPTATLTAVDAPITALMATDDDAGSRAAALATVSAAREAAGRRPIDLVSFGDDGHNLMRYRPSEVATAIASVGRPGR